MTRLLRVVCWWRGHVWVTPGIGHPHTEIRCARCESPYAWNDDVELWLRLYERKRLDP